LRINKEKVKELETKESRTPGKSLTYKLYLRDEDTGGGRTVRK
jgi:hypothetical protein